MKLSIESRHLNGVVVVVSEVYQDDRGFFTRTFRKDQFLELGLPGAFVQDNHSRSAKNVVRGLHFQWDPPMGKLMQSDFRQRLSRGSGHPSGLSVIRKVVRC